MAVYQRGKNWYIDFTFHGERIREMIGPSRKGAEKVIAKKKAEIAENKFLDVRKDPEPVNFHEFAVKYMQWAKVNKKESTYIRQLSMLRRLDKKFGEKDMRKITGEQVETYKTNRAMELKKTGAKTQPATVNREIALLKHIYSMAIEWGRIEENPLRKIKLLKGEKARLRYLMPEELQRLLSNCPSHLKPIVTVAAHTGMRRGEIFNLKWEQVNFDQGIISILDSKNGERGDIPMNDTARRALQGVERKGELVFSNGNGKSLVSLAGPFNTAVKNSGIKDFHFHDLRHTFASNLAMAGVDILTIKELMRHKKIEMTLRYAHLAPNYKTRAVNILDQVFSLTSPKSPAAPKEPASGSTFDLPILDMSPNPPHLEGSLTTH